MLRAFADPVRALLFTLGGALLAWLGSTVSLLAAGGLVLAVFLGGLMVAKAGERLVGSRDRLGMRLMETRLISIAALTAALGALGIVIGVELAAPADTTGYPKELLTTVSGALVAFITGLSVTAEKADAAVGAYIRDVFQKVYQRDGSAIRGQVRVRANSRAENAIMSSSEFGLTDWTHDNRWERLDILWAPDSGRLDRVL